MKKELTEKNIRANLKKEFGTKPFRLGILAIFAGLIVSVLCFGTGRLPGTLVGLIVLVIGIIETAKSTRFKQKIDRLPLTVKEDFCVEKRIRSGAGGTKRYFYFTKNKSYLASSQDIKLWEKTKPGDKFYVVYLDGKKDIKKIYPEKVLKYVKD